MAARLLKERGAYTIYVMATHGLLSSNAPSMIEDSCIDEVIKQIPTCLIFQFLYFIQWEIYIYNI